MATKTWKIGEYAKGGIITVKTTNKKVVIIGKEWDYSKGSTRRSDQSGAKEWTRKEIDTTRDNNSCFHILMFLEDLTTPYYASQIIIWIETKIDLKC